MNDFELKITKNKSVTVEQVYFVLFNAKLLVEKRKLINHIVIKTLLCYKTFFNMGLTKKYNLIVVPSNR
jgi:hypothetical protein